MKRTVKGKLKGKNPHWAFEVLKQCNGYYAVTLADTSVKGEDLGALCGGLGLNDLTLMAKALNAILENEDFAQVKGK